MTQLSIYAAKEEPTLFDSDDPDASWREWATDAATKLLRRGEGFGIAHSPGRGRSSILWTFDSHTYSRTTGRESTGRAWYTFTAEVGHRVAREAKR